MATFYKRGGKKNKGGTWYIQYFDENGKRCTVKGCSDRDATEALARKLEADVMLRKRGVIDTKLDRYAVEGRRPIGEHLDEWIQDLESRDITAKQVQLTSGRAKRLLELAGIERLNEITPSAIQNALAKLREKGRAAKTLNDTLTSVKQFCGWARADGRISENPIDSVKGFNTRTDRRHDRRALTDDEVRQLIRAAENGPALLGCSGIERALIYRLAVLSGLRANEIRTLKKRSFILDETQPAVIVQAAFSKHRREDIQPLPSELVPLLRDYLKDINDGDMAFDVPKKFVQALRQDLEAAGIPYETHNGFADFHALRHTFITRLIKSGVNPKTAQTLARHQDASLTLNRYSHVEVIDKVAALRQLPLLEGPITDTQRQKVAATGTDGLKDVGTSVGTQAAFDGKGWRSEAQMYPEKDNRKSDKVSVLGVGRQFVAGCGKNVRKERETGFEPATLSLEG